MNDYYILQINSHFSLIASDALGTVEWQGLHSSLGGYWVNSAISSPAREEIIDRKRLVVLFGAERMRKASVRRVCQAETHATTYVNPTKNVRSVSYAACPYVFIELSLGNASSRVQFIIPLNLASSMQYCKRRKWSQNRRIMCYFGSVLVSGKWKTSSTGMQLQKTRSFSPSVQNNEFHHHPSSFN